MPFDIVHSITIKASPEKVFDALTTKTGISGWWTKRNSARPKFGAVQQFKFDKWTTLTFRVDEFDPPRHVVWTALWVPDDWKGTAVTFDLDPVSDGVELFFMHSGFASQDGIYGITNYSWAQYIRSLKLFVEKGRGEAFGSRGSIACGTTPRKTG